VVTEPGGWATGGSIRVGARKLQDIAGQTSGTVGFQFIYGL
jgi:hypothetical protein